MEFVIAASPALLGLGTSAVVVGRSRRPCGKRSGLEPPPWVFRVVWPILYILLGIVGLLVWRSTSRSWSDPSFVTWMVLTGMLILWWPLFTIWCFPFASASTLAAITVYSILATLQFRSTDAIASALNLPLNMWLIFASILSFMSAL